MEEFQAYATEEVILDNLAEIYARICHSEEQERAHLRELAAEIANGIADSDTDASAFLASLSAFITPPFFFLSFRSLFLAFLLFLHKN